MIYQGSLLRVELPFVDVKEDGSEEPINFLGIEEASIRVWRPDGTEITDPQLVVVDSVTGEAYWDGEMDQRGIWRAQGFVDGYRSAPVSWRVYPNPFGS